MCDYEVIPLTKAYGAVIKGLNLAALDQRCAEKIRKEAFMHRFLVFKKQDLPWQDQISLTSLFGTPHEETKTPNRQKDDKSPDIRIAVFSNDPKIGLKGNGIEGWHVDGNTVDVPHLFTFIYCIKPNRNGPTLVVPLREIVESFSKEERQYLDTIYFVSAANSSIVHPLIYKHPYRNDDTIFMALGTLSGQYLQDREDGERRVLTKDETRFIMDLLEARIMSSNLIFSMNYEPGDLLMVNNHAVSHIAGPGSQLPPEVSGTRLIHRTTARGVTKPSKNTNIDYQCAKLKPFEDGYCLFSLKDSVFYPRLGFYDSQSTARQRCNDVNRFADLATISNEEWNNFAKPIISEKGRPHWTNASNPSGRDIFWGDSKGSFSNWDSDSNQPNDHGGNEGCVMIGAFGKWYDIPCSGPKFWDPENQAPVTVWEDGIRKMLNIFPLCGVPQNYVNV